MKINKAYKFRIYPTESQKEYFDQCFRASNFIYNFFLAEQKEIDDVLIMYGLTNKKERAEYKTKNNLWFQKYSASSLLTSFSKTKFQFLQEVDSTMRSVTLDNLDRAFKNIKKTGAGFPKFKSKYKNKSFTGGFVYNGKVAPQNFSIKTIEKKKWCQITIPNSKKAGSIKTVIHRENFKLLYTNKELLKLLFYTISLSPQGEYYISILVEEEAPDVEKKEITEETAIGIDRGVVRPITTSNDQDFQNELFASRFDILKKEKEKLDHLQRILAKKRRKNPNWKNSNKYKKLKNKLSKIHGKISNKRENLQHNITKQLVEKDGINTFVLEDLKMKNMTKRSAKGKSNRKRHLSRVMLDVGMYSIETKLIYKATWKGKNVEKVDAKYTSQKCSDCGHINKLSRVSQAKFVCTECGSEHNADKNAARNIKNKFFNNFVTV